jgi:hypothetical protein
MPSAFCWPEPERRLGRRHCVAHHGFPDDVDRNLSRRSIPTSTPLRPFGLRLHLMSIPW